MNQEQLSFAVLQAFLAIEEEILSNMANYLKKPKLDDDTDIIAWQVECMSMLGKLTQENLITISKNSGTALDEMIELLKLAGYTAVGDVDADLTGVLMAGQLIQPASPAASLALTAILNTYTQQAVDIFNMTNTTMLYQANQTYTNIVNETVGKVLAGVKTPRNALAEIAAKWAYNGVPALIDKAGKKWSVEGYVNMVIRTTSNNVANDMQLERMKEFNVDLIEISSHLDARPNCAPYQGRIYSQSGTSDKYPPLSSTSYGEADGIKGVNCRHIFYPFIEGRSRQTYTPYPEYQVDKAYKESQQQRKLERDIRKAKTQLGMYDKIGDMEQIDKAKAKVKNKQANMRAFIESSGRTRRYEREQIV